MSAELIASIVGAVGGIITVANIIARVFQRKADNEATRIEIEAQHSRAVLERVQRLEFSEASADKKIEELSQRATAAEVRAATLEWELARARQETEAERARSILLTRELSDLKRQRLGLEDDREDRDTLRPPKGKKG